MELTAHSPDLIARLVARWHTGAVKAVAAIHPGNIVMDGERVSGFIDFDHLCLGPRLLDLAQFIVH